jgi:hypothetical protein
VKRAKGINKSAIAIFLVAAISFKVEATQPFNSSSLLTFSLSKALPTLCQDYACYNHYADETKIKERHRQGHYFTIETPESFLDTTSITMPSRKRLSVKAKVKRYIYAALNRKPGINVKSYTEIKISEYLRFNIEPYFNFKGHFDEIKLTAILFE